MHIEKNKSLRPHNTFNVDVQARHFVTITSTDALKILLDDTCFCDTPKLILGEGSNLLFTRDFEGLVIHNQIKGIEKINEDDEYVWIKAAAGENWHQLVLYCIQNNYAGIENLSLIPGTVGAAPVQNIGAYGVELKEVLECVDAIDLDNNTSCIFHNTDCELHYRDSIFKNQLKNKMCITHVTLRLNKNPVFHTTYGDIQKELRDETMTIKTISDAIIRIRQSKLPDPKKIPNAGSFFRNPVITKKILTDIQKQFFKVPHFPIDDDYVKIPAAWLIEQCGLKGKRCGNVGVHQHQALVLVNYGHDGSAIQKLADEIRQTVHERFHVLLNTEVNVC
ncbi:MAG: UDP-N-acetylenolpyruvoylglucosamine reductase [Gammaproteobacteria bacterium RIFCSPLOWO2_02_FULL_42_14]|nr:MAG: UDP-N-acetylenolpyruvoylglucosamine reductase [Gammaproteobacteria bacterium RIFCSPHIGHO2_02_FULL_42_43]OGT27662.1 MAG: UDP-N-acetylenolpyruvoylglucosamine reductase [Gammaproteobacteria bacterium RIFCSPHIGHO2_01_FULL_42_8]OGT52156.1 MAG: UDP-N-acetylenolpyruvoylglucosamine reductase [Gammaproteobacteria bacterium RIFCSPHIGHO2_12_FULL_41_25]OGT62594.1 MAG: UDP-N-acetylenolpyruvoylglucosamine reductase [Gammaproteobacteria bacterium RIFCSPLOWO2_02_FULL_42_14]OGT86576.1 MAG: UDP-N-acetyle